MKNELDSRFILSVFDKIQQHGEKADLGTVLDGVKAYTDHDGYTLYLQDALVLLQFGFHNQYRYEYEQATHLEQFEKKLHNIHKQY